MTLAVFTYQGTVALFVVLSIPFAFYHAKNFREYVCNIISIGVCYAVPVLLAFAAFKWVFNGTRLQTDFNLLANLKEFFGGLWMCNMETFDIFPHYIFLLAVLLILGVLTVLALVIRVVILVLIVLFIIVRHICDLLIGNIFLVTGVVCLFRTKICQKIWYFRPKFLLAFLYH